MGKHTAREPEPKKVGCTPEQHGRTTISGGKDRQGHLIHLCSRCGGKVNF